MMFSGAKRRWIGGILLLGLVGCTGASRSRPPSPDTTAPPTIGATTELTPEPAPNPPEPIAAAEGDIWSKLRQADRHYYVLIRHAIAPGTGDPANFQLDDCSTQRNLSAAGRAQAQATGEAFRQKNVAVQQVLSSEWCRCLETAELMALGPVERFPPLNSFFQNRAQEPERTAQLQAFMVNNQADRGVTVLVTHFVNISAITGSGVTSGEMVVMQVNDQNRPEVVGPLDWSP
jgi:phosphohistidine phosphatase SixA